MGEMAELDAEEEAGGQGEGKSRRHQEEMAQTVRQRAEETQKETKTMAGKEVEEKARREAKEKARKEAEENPAAAGCSSKEDALGLLLRAYRLEPAETRPLLAHFGVNDVEVYCVTTHPPTHVDPAPSDIPIHVPTCE